MECMYKVTIGGEWSGKGPQGWFGDVEIRAVRDRVEGGLRLVGNDRSPANTSLVLSPVVGIEKGVLSQGRADARVKRLGLFSRAQEGSVDRGVEHRKSEELREDPCDLLTGSTGGLFGKITVIRSVYQANGEQTVCPLEVNAGILHHHLTPAAAEFVAYSTAHMVPGELAEFCRRWQYLTPSETVIKQAAGEIGEMAEMLQDIHEEAARKEEGPPPAETAVVTISRDGTNLNIREEGWRQAQVGAISLYGPLVEPEGDGEGHRDRLRTVYTAHMPEENSPSFDAKFDREVEHTLKRLPQDTAVVCIADGSLGIWRDFEEHPELKDAVHINDFWHAAQYAAKAGKARVLVLSRRWDAFWKSHEKALSANRIPA